MEIGKIASIKTSQVYSEQVALKKRSEVKLPVLSTAATTRIIENTIESQQKALENMKVLIAQMELNNEVSIEYDDQTKQVIVQVVDGDTKAVVKQFPPEQLISFMRKFQEIVGLIINEKA